MRNIYKDFLDFSFKESATKPPDDGGFINIHLYDIMFEVKRLITKLHGNCNRKNTPRVYNLIILKIDNN